MAKRWKQRPSQSNWGDFGDNDQLGRLNLITPDKVLEGISEVKEGRVFSLSLPLDLPGGNVLNPARLPPRLTPTTRPDGTSIFLHSLEGDHNTTDVVCDDMVTLCLQYSTQWDALAHVGSRFDADGDGQSEVVFYNGFRAGTDIKQPGACGAGSSADFLGIENMARHGVQGRGVMVDLRRHFGDERVAVGFNDIEQVLASDGVDIRPGDMVCFHTGFADVVLSMQGNPDAQRLNEACAVLDGHDPRLQEWVIESGIAAIIADNYAVEHRPYDFYGDGCHPLLPLHELCLFKLGIPLGELWYLTDLANWLYGEGRHAFLLSAPPLYLPGAVGSALNPIATV